MNIAFIIGSCELAGGNYVLLQHASYLQKQGHNVTIVHLLPNPERMWHPAQDSLTFLPFSDALHTRFDLAIATWWGTVYHLYEIRASHYAYFVQSIESWYCKDKDLDTRQRIDATYLPPIPVITEAHWIKKYLEDQFGTQVFLALNGIRKDFLTPYGATVQPRPSTKLRVLVEGPLGIDFKNVPNAIRLAKKAGVDEIWWLTSSDITWYPGVDRVFSRVTVDKVGEIYRSCNVLLKLSYVEGMFGPPLEMFHCGGTAVVYDITGADEYIKHEKNALVVPVGDEDGVVYALRQLKNSPELLSQLQQGALKTAEKWPNWNEASAYFLKAVTSIAQLCKISPEQIKTSLEDFNYSCTATQNEKKSVLKSWSRKFIQTFPKIKHMLLPFWYYLQHRIYRRLGQRTKVCSLPKSKLARAKSLRAN